MDDCHVVGCATKVNKVKYKRDVGVIWKFEFKKKLEGIPKCFDNSLISSAVFQSKMWKTLVFTTFLNIQH